MSGIAAGNTLHNAGYTNLILIEGTDRIGGRIRSADLGGYNVEQGSWWIYGRGSNPVWQLASQSKVPLSVASNRLRNWMVYDTNGRNVTNMADRLYTQSFRPAYQRLISTSKRDQRAGTEDCSARAGLRSAGWVPKTALHNVIEYLSMEFETGTAPEENSVKQSAWTSYADAFGDGTILFVNDPRGYIEIVRRLAAGFLSPFDPRLRLNEVATMVQDIGGRSKVLTTRSSYICDKVIITCSLGVLQHRQIQIQPPFPDWKMQAIDKLSMKNFVHFYFLFPFKFWDDNQYLAYAGERKGFYSVWINMETLYPGSRILQLSLSDDEADRASRMSDTQIINEAVSVLRKMYPYRKVSYPIGYNIFHWGKDPMFRGSWINWPIGYSLDTHLRLQRPVRNIYFAGEHMSAEHFGFAHGAYFSGVKTAQEVLGALAKHPLPVFQATPVLLAPPPVRLMPVIKG